LFAVDVSACYLKTVVITASEDYSYVTQLYSLKSVGGSGVWMPVGTPANGTLLDFSQDASMVAVHGGGTGGKEPIVTAYTISASMSNVSATNSAIPTSAPTHPTIWKAAGDGFDVPRNMKISSSATALSFHGDVIAIGSVDHSKNSTFQGQVNVWGLKNSTTSTGTELTWSTLGQVLEGAEPQDCFGVSVALWANGMVLAVGATQLSDVYGSVATGGGYVQVYSMQGDIWLPRGARARSGQLLRCLRLRSCIV
jgi:hypothetical protein